VAGRDPRHSIARHLPSAQRGGRSLIADQRVLNEQENHIGCEIRRRCLTL